MKYKITYKDSSGVYITTVYADTEEKAIDILKNDLGFIDIIKVENGTD